MKDQLQDLLNKCIQELISKGTLNEMPSKIRIDHTKDNSHGDYATNIALMLSKQAKMSPVELAKIIIDQFEQKSFIKKIEIAGPGFINFFMSQETSSSIVNEIIDQAALYGSSEIGHGKKVLLEYVSANPTGPLHVGHGRGAAYGATVSNLLRNAGFIVDNEYYVNDAGRQMDILTVSIYLRYLTICGESLRFPDNGYQGQYINDIAQVIYEASGQEFHLKSDLVFENVSKDGSEGGDKEIHIDQLIERAKSILGDRFKAVFKVGIESILGGIKNDLAEFGVIFEKWFSEQSLIDSGLSEACILKLKDSKNLYEKDGALWFKLSLIHI